MGGGVRGQVVMQGSWKLEKCKRQIMWEIVSNFEAFFENLTIPSGLHIPGVSYFVSYLCILDVSLPILNR